MTNDEIVARSICKSLNMGNDRFWAAYRAEARAVLAALSSAGRSCPQCAENERSMEIIRKAAERLTELEAAPDATDWKARCEASEKWCNLYTEDIARLGELLGDESARLTAAQAENEKLRDALDKAAMYARARSECYGSSPMGTYAEGHKDASSILLTQIEALIAAISPPPLSPEKE